MKQGVKVFLILLTIISIIIAIFATSVITIGDKQYFDVKYNIFRMREGDNVTYFYISANGYDFVLRVKRDRTGTLHINQDGAALGSVPVTRVLTSSGTLNFRIENNGLNVMKIVDLVNYHLQGTFPTLPSFDFSGGFFSDLKEVLVGVFDLLYYPFEISIYIVDTIVGGFKLFGGGFKL